MTIPLTVLLIGSILSLDILILISIKYIVSMTNWMKELREISQQEYETILPVHTPKPNISALKSKGSNVVYFNSYSKVK